MTKIATPNEAIVDLSSEPENELEQFVGVTDGFAWYELSRLQIQAEQMAVKLKNLQDTLKQQADAQYTYFAHLRKKLEDAEDEKDNRNQGS